MTWNEAYFGQQLKKHRGALRYQQASKETGIPAKSLYAYETGKREPSASRFMALCQWMGQYPGNFVKME